MPLGPGYRLNKSAHVFSNITRCCYLFVDMEVDAENDTHPSGMVNGHTDTDTSKTDSDPKSKSKLRLSFEEYRSMARTIAGHLRAEEYRAGDGKAEVGVISILFLLNNMHIYYK